MSVLLIIVTVFIEMLIAVVAVVAFAFLLREYATRRSAFLTWFALSFCCLALVLAVLFLGHVLAAFGHQSAALSALMLSPLFGSLQGTLAIFGIVELTGQKRSRLVRGGALALLGIGVAAIILGPSGTVTLSGMEFLRFDPWALLVASGPWLVSSLLLAVQMGGRVLADRKASRETSASDRWLLDAGVAGILFVVGSVVSTAFDLRILLPVNFALLLLHLALLFVGVVSHEHPDADIRRRPSLLFSKSLVFKAVSVNAAILWLLALGLLAITSSYFVSSSLDARRASLRRDLHYFTKSYASYSLTLLEETSRLASLPGLVQTLTKAPDMMPDAISDFMRNRRGTRIIRIIDQEGVILYSSYFPEEIGKRMAASLVVEKALMGKKLAAIEKEDAFGIWAVRAGVPIIGDDGSTFGVILDTDVESAFDFSDYSSISPLFATGYGFVAESGEQVYSSGQAIDALTRSVLRNYLGPGSYSPYQSDDALYLAERVYTTDGAPNGFFYIFLTTAMIDAQVFRVVSVVTLLVILAVMLLTVILLFGMTVVLNPIRELRRAAAKVERESYDLRIKYRSPDELGQLAESFNKMQATIQDRTSALKEAVREQQDFLEHTTRELRTPLNIFRWTLELMRFGDTGRLNKEQLELIEQLNQTNERLITMVQKLQDAIRIDRRRLALKIEDVVVEDVIDEVAGAMAVSSRKKNLALHWNRPKKPLPPAYADRGYLRKVVANLVGNAVKYTLENGHIEIDIEETDEASPGGRKGKFLKVTVEDNGIGIPKDDLPHAFTRFFRARNVVGSEIEGTGLGLYIAKQIVELHGGAIGIESREGVGTTVAFTVPTEKPRPARQIATKPS